MTGCDFFEEGDPAFPSGNFRVRHIDHQADEFICVRLTGGTKAEVGQVTNFDIGYVIITYESQRQDARVRGIGEVLSHRTRGSGRVSVSGVYK